MKLTISLDQWHELNDEEKLTLLEHHKEQGVWRPNLGEMMDYLETPPNDIRSTVLCEMVNAEYLCDVLWEACKYKIRKDV